MKITKCLPLAAAAILIFLFPATCYGYCGVSSRRKLDPVLLTSSTSFVNFTSKDLRTLCERVGVHGRGRGPCRRSVEVAGVLVEAAWTGVRQCQALMQYERWNCSLGKTRRRIMRRVFRETAFLQALSSASVTHVVSRACAQGRLTHCSCGYVSSDGDGERHLRAWRWGGCGDNVRHGSRFAAKLFIDGGREEPKRRVVPQAQAGGKARSYTRLPRSQDFKSRIDIHNARVGIMTVQNTARETCKCHGVSGSCSMRTCWIQLPSFAASAAAIKQLYDTAVLAVTNNAARLSTVRVAKRKKKQRLPRAADEDGTPEDFRRLPEYRNFSQAMYGRERWREIVQSQPQENELSKYSRKRIARTLVNDFRRPSRKSQKRGKSSRRLRFQKRPLKSNLGDPSQLLYLDNPPNFCRKTRYGPGTRNRFCKRRNCESLCCGRGYDTSVAFLEEPCRCRVVWCCHVHCHNCSRTAEIYTCK